MKLKKLLTAITAVTAAALLLTACTGGGGDSDTPDGGSNGEPIDYLTVSDFSAADAELAGHPNMSAYFSRFNNDSSDSLSDELLAASVASYLDNTAYSLYFIADWWGEKDEFSDKGFLNFENYVSDSLMTEIRTLNEEKDKDPLGAKYFYHQPKALESYGPSEMCFDTWEEISCMYPYKTETMNIISSNNHRAVVEVTSEYTVYVTDEYGGGKDQKVSYSATLELENNKKLTDVAEQPFFVVKSVEGGYTYGDPADTDLE